MGRWSGNVLKVEKFEDWPLIDRQLWAKAFEVGDWLDGNRYPRSLRPMTLRNVQRGWGRVICVMRERGGFNPAIRPALRVTREAMNYFVDALRREGNCNNSIMTRLMDVRVALRILEPDEDFSWIVNDGVPVGQLLPVEETYKPAADTAALKSWAVRRMVEAAAKPLTIRSAVAYRDGLLTALLAERAPRLRSIASMRDGIHIFPHDRGYRIVIPPKDVKNKKRLEYDVPEGLTEMIDFYREVIRPLLLRGKVHDKFWVGQLGEPFTERGIQAVYQRHASDETLAGMSPHDFRHALATAAAERDPANPGIAACLLGVSEKVVAKSYRRVRHQLALKRFQTSVEQERARSDGVDLFGSYHLKADA